MTRSTGKTSRINSDANVSMADLTRVLRDLGFEKVSQVGSHRGALAGASEARSPDPRVVASA